MDFSDFTAAPQVVFDDKISSGHHKKHSTFANVPFADTNGMDDFFGYSVEETQQKEINELKDMVKENQDLIDKKDKIIKELRLENDNLKQTVNILKDKLQSKSNQNSNSNDNNDDNNNNNNNDNDNDNDLILTNIAIAPVHSTNMHSDIISGSALFSKTPSSKNLKNTNNKFLEQITTNSNKSIEKHNISPSLNQFLDKLDFTFKEDVNSNKSGNDNDNNVNIMDNISNNDNNIKQNDMDPIQENDDALFIYNPSALLNINGSLPKIRRSSLSEEEQEEMEKEALKSMQNLQQNVDVDDIGDIDDIDDIDDDKKGNSVAFADKHVQQDIVDDNINKITPRGPVPPPPTPADTVSAGGYNLSGVSSSYSNLIFNESNVKNMNMNIINHHTHKHDDPNMINNNIINKLKQSIVLLKNELERVQLSKIQLIINTSTEIDSLRKIIQQRLKS